MDLHVGENKVINLDLQVGQVSETVNVSSDAAPIETRSGDISSLITEKQVDLALTCDRSVRYVEGSRPEFASQRAFYAALAERGTWRFEAMGCGIAEVR